MGTECFGGASYRRLPNLVFRPIASRRGTEPESAGTRASRRKTDGQGQARRPLIQGRRFAFGPVADGPAVKPTR
jgi:hypothetical protein